MKFSPIQLLLAGAMAIGATSCEESLTAGGSLVEGETEIVRDSTFTVTGIPDANPAVKSRTILQLLGRIDAEGYGNFSSDIVCQYMASAALDTTGVKSDYIDSVKLVLTMYKDGFAGDSVAPMGLTVHRLNKLLPTTLNSDFDPSGYYDEEPIGSTTYSALIDGYEGIGTDSEGSIFKNIYVTLPRQLGVDLFNEYKNSPSTFSTPSTFAKWFPGLYIANSFGSGRVTRFSNNSIYVYYHSITPIESDTNPRDTTINKIGAYLGVTPEVYTNNNIRYTMSPKLRAMADAGETILVGPTGYDVEFTFPAREILARYQSGSGPLAVVNSLSFKLPVEEIENDYGITPPPYVLMIKKSEREKFFSKMQVSDNLNSFYATYDASTRSYTFTSMLDYINDIIKNGKVEPEDEEFVICPVQVSFYPTSQSSSYYSYYYYGYNTTSQTVSSITPYVTQPVMVKLDFPNAEIKFSFSKQTL